MLASVPRASCAAPRAAGNSARRPRAAAAAAAAAAAPLDEEEAHEALVAATQRIRQLGLGGDAQGAVAVLAELGGAGIQPDARAVTATLNACITAGDVPRAERTLRDLLDARAVQPDELMFSLLLRAHGGGAEPKWTDISALLGLMKHTWGIAPSAITYNALLDICARQNDYERGCQLIDRMMAEQVETDAFTVAAVSSRKSLRSYLRRALQGEE